MNELYQAYIHSCQTYEPKTVAKATIDAHVARGKFVVIERSLAYCPITDATLPITNSHLSGVFDNREDAHRHSLTVYEDSCGEVTTKIYPEILAPRAKITLCEDELPF